MFDDLFPMFENYDTSTVTNSTNKENSTAINCGTYLEKPESSRRESNFVGLFNQGGTCYMNSSLQVLFMNPLFRQIIYDLPLCENDDITTPSNFVQQGPMYEILLAIQKLFIRLHKYDILAISTKHLTEAFNWTGSDGSVQHDSQEFFNLFFETLEGILSNTSFNGVINNLYRVNNFSYRVCSNCNHMNTSEEFNLDITVNVKDRTGLLDCLDGVYNNLEIINDYKCDQCKQKVDLKKGNKICQLPLLLNFCLNKMDYDLNTFERVKLTTRFEFPLELDMSKYVTEDLRNSVNPEEFKYELYSLIIHRGTPYSGHYFSYIRDLNEEGNWNLTNLNNFRSEPEKKEEVKINENVEKEENKAKEENNNDNKKGKKQKNKGKEKNKTNQEKEYEKLNFDECDHPIHYDNTILSIRWFNFNDTSITPIRVGRLQKQFESSESAYILFYMKKNVQINKTVPPIYLEKYIEELNSEITSKRFLYEEETKSISIQIFNSNNFFIDQFNILSVKDSIDLEKSENQFNLKLKFYNTLEQVLAEIKKINNEKDEDKDLILYEIIYKKESNAVIVISKYDYLMKDMNLESLKICHNSRFILVNKSHSNDNMHLNTETIDKVIGPNYEPIKLHIIHGANDKIVKIYNNTDIQTFKSFVKNYLKIDFEISLIFKNNDKNINLEKVGFDKKNNCWLNLKQLRVVDKSVIFITKSEADNKYETKSNNLNEALNNDEELNEKINCIVKIEDEDDFTIVKTRLNKTFEQLVEKIKKKLKLNENEENTENNLENVEKAENSILIRLRKELDGRIINKNQYNKKLSSEEMFLDGGVRLRIEFGEPYEYHEILLKILMETGGKKSIKEFIGDPEKTIISELKKFICEQFNLKPEEHLFYKTSALLDPIKALKNENQTLTKVALKDNDTIFLKNNSSEIHETYYIKIHHLNKVNDPDFVFKPIDDSSFVLELNLPKDTTLKQLKEQITSNLNLDSTEVSNIRIRTVGKKLDPDRILRGDSTPLKKLNIDNPSTLLYEILPQEENLKDNQIQLYLWKRNVTEKKYEGKKSVIFEFKNNFASSDQLYDFCRREFELRDISIAKYAKFNYLWETIPEMNENGPINLRKVYNLRDGDWIGVRCEEENQKGLDDFQTNEDKKTLQIIKSMKIESGKETMKKSKVVEKPLRIPKFN